MRRFLPRWFDSLGLGWKHGGPYNECWDQGDLVIRTKGDGTFKVDLPPGFYDVFVAGMAFSPTCRKIRVKPGEGLEVTLRMNADPLYTAEMGSRIEAIPPKR
jgi:hypothetical protein